MVTVTAVMKSKPEEWDTAARAWEQMATATEGIAKDVRAQASGWGDAETASDEWSGAGAHQASATVGTLVDHLGASGLEFRSVAMVMRGAEHAFDIAKTTLHNAIREAEFHGLTVADDGSVTAHATTADHKDPTTMAAINRTVTEVGNLVRIALREADQADSKVAQELGKLAHPNGIPSFGAVRGDGQNADLQQASNLEVQLLMDSVPNGKTDDPQTVAAWWNGLTPQEQQVLQLAAPTRLATLNGIPESVRKHLTTSATNSPGAPGVNPAGVVAWADNNWMHGATLHNDCTRFTSEALFEGGGKPFDGQWRPGMRQWTFGPSFQKYMETGHRSDPVTRNDVRPGDILIWTTSHGRGQHAAVVTAVVDGHVKYAAHSNGLDNGDLDLRTRGWLDDDGKPMQIEFRRPRGSADVANPVRP